MVHNLKISIILLTTAGVLSIGYAQNCDEHHFQELINKSEIFALSDRINKKEVNDLRNQLEAFFNSCWDAESCSKSLYKVYLLNMMNLSGRLSDIEGKVNYLEQMKNISTNSADWRNLNVGQQLALIKATYGTLKIGIESDMLSEMAVLKDENGSNIKIHFLRPPNVWSNEKYEYKEEREARLEYIVNKSANGELQLFFDSYSYEDSIFYCEIPYVPYLDVSDNSEDWYGITFNEQKRYRVKFSSPLDIEESIKPLIIQPENNWHLETSIPEHYIKLNYYTSSRRLKFFDRDTEQPLRRDEYIIIVRGDNITDYYLPSDRNLKIEFPDQPSQLYKVLGIGLYSIVGLSLGYIAFQAVN